MSRSSSNDVSTDRSTLRTVFRDTFRSREISLIVLPLMKCSRRIRPIVSTVSIPPPLAWNQSEQRIRSTCRGSILDADPPAQGVKIARRMTAELSAIAIQELAPYSEKDQGRVRIEGPQVLLEPNTALAVAVTLHELATN